MKILFIYLFLVSHQLPSIHIRLMETLRGLCFSVPPPPEEKTGWLVEVTSPHMLFSLTVACFGGGEGFYQLIPMLYTRWLDIFVY